MVFKVLRVSLPYSTVCQHSCNDLVCWLLGTADRMCLPSDVSQKDFISCCEKVFAELSAGLHFSYASKLVYIWQSVSDVDVDLPRLFFRLFAQSGVRSGKTYRIKKTGFAQIFWAARLKMTWPTATW